MICADAVVKRMVQNSVRWLMNEFLWIVLQIIKSQIKLIVLILFFFQKLGESTELATLMQFRCGR